MVQVVAFSVQFVTGTDFFLMSEAVFANIKFGLSYLQVESAYGGNQNMTWFKQGCTLL